MNELITFLAYMPSFLFAPALDAYGNLTRPPDYTTVVWPGSPPHRAGVYFMGDTGVLNVTHGENLSSKNSNGNLSLFYRIPVNRMRLSSRKTQETSNEDFNPLFLLLAFEVQFHCRSYPSLAPSARLGHLAWQGWRKSQKTDRMRLR